MKPNHAFVEPLQVGIQPQFSPQSVRGRISLHVCSVSRCGTLKLWSSSSLGTLNVRFQSIGCQTIRTKNAEHPDKQSHQWLSPNKLEISEGKTTPTKQHTQKKKTPQTTKNQQPSSPK